MKESIMVTIYGFLNDVRFLNHPNFAMFF
jgi:hypothetical protein